MAAEVIMPRVDMDMTEGKIAHWYVKSGDAVTKGQVLFEIETDKATMEVDAPVSGTIEGVCGVVGETISVGANLGWILAPGESLPARIPSLVLESQQNEETSDSTTLSRGRGATQTPIAKIEVDGAMLRATPLARSLARAQGVDLSSIVGSGPEGRIQGTDVMRVAETGRSPARSTDEQDDTDALLYLKWIARGKGAPLVLLHGFGADHGSWRNLASHIEGIPIIGIDLPSHGRSIRYAAASLEDVAAAVVSRLDQEGIWSFHLMGHSLGGAVATAMIRLANNRLKSLTLLAPAGLGPDINGSFIDGLCRAQSEASLKPWLAELFHDQSLLTNSFIATAFKQLESPEKRAHLKTLAQALMPNGTQANSTRNLLEQVSVPTKVIWGTDDNIIPIKHAQGLPGRVAFHSFKNVGHLLYVEAVDAVVTLVMEQMR